MTTKVRVHDDKVHLISLEKWLEINNYLVGVTKKDFWNPSKRPEPFESYYLLTGDKLISIFYCTKCTNFGMTEEEKLECIFYAFRDGVEEYSLFDKKEDELNQYLTLHKYSKKTVEQIKQLKKARKLLPNFENIKKIKSQNFKDNIVDSLYKSNDLELAKKYVVLDVETNGLRKASDDLISISIYDPLNGLCYNRMLPLHLQPLVLTSWIHNITNDDLKNAMDISQTELDWLIDYFNLKERIILTYSGGKGTFDSDFLENYFKRQSLMGYEGFIYENIKNLLPKVNFGYEGQLSKDNICNILGIDGVKEIHSSLNDCLLEWKLFEKLKRNKYFLINGSIYNYSDRYIAPITYLINYPSFKEVTNITLPTIIGKVSSVFTYHVPRKLLNVIKKYPTNITGIALETGINFNLDIEKQNNLDFLIRNKENLEFVGSLTSNFNEIPIIEDNKSGNLIAIKEEDKAYINEINKTTQILMNNFSSLFNYIKNNIFKNEVIKGQELVVSHDRKILAICDLSSESSILEIKSYGIIKDNNNLIGNRLALQLFFESNNRNIYLLSIDFKKHFNKKFEQIIDDIEVNIYKVDLKKVNDDNSIKIYKLNKNDVDVLKCIKSNRTLTQQKISDILNLSKKQVSFILKILKSFGYIEKIDYKTWNILREEEDVCTKYTIKNGLIDVLKQ